jgi:hypothetical protein
MVNIIKKKKKPKAHTQGMTINTIEKRKHQKHAPQQ